jgi:hypothetical protein
MFKTFPEFSSISLADREAYERFIADFPPISDLSFTTLMIWWNFGGSLRIAQLNGNLVISYYLPGDEENSGLSLIGSNNIDASIQAIFAEQARLGQPQRVVHVPECVVDSIAQKEALVVENERDYDEYLVPLHNYFPLERAKASRRWAINRFLRDLHPGSVEITSLDLSQPVHQELLITKASLWEVRNNDGPEAEKLVMEATIRSATVLGFQNVCLLVQGELAGFALYQIPVRGDAAILNHMRADTKYPRSFDYMTYVVCRELAQQGFTHMNFEMDLGIPGLRRHKEEMEPDGFFKKYRLEPALDTVEK